MIELFADGADMRGIIAAAQNKKITGFTTNPTLMKQAGVTDYETFSKHAIEYLASVRPGTSISLEVFADDYNNMLEQARVIDSWGKERNYDVYVKIPVTNTKAIPSYDLVNQLSNEGIKVNVTAIFTNEQITNVLSSLNKSVPAIVSVFAGRIADAGVDPMPIISAGLALRNSNTIKFLWASTREAYNYFQAQQCGCDIITMTPDLIKKMSNFGKDLTQYSLETVKMFYNDATESGYKI
jgi:transaldolase